jgi:hypothetical protein
MTLLDARGQTLSTSERSSAEAYDRALALFNGFRSDPLAVLEAALAQEPGFVSGRLMQAGLLLGAFDGQLLPMAQSALDAAAACARHANAREKSLLGALTPWAAGDLKRGSDRLGRHLVDHPRDLFALQLAHLGDLLLGQSQMLRDRVARVLGHWSRDDVGYGYVLGMHAFGLEECNEYARAESLGRRAVELQPHDVWAVHAVAHVCEMQGRAADGIAWLSATRGDWAIDNGMAVHNHWHLALMHLSNDDTAAALALYDDAVAPGPQSLAMDLSDASALLWRLALRGSDVGARWQSLAARWRQQAAWGSVAFNDMHAMMALAAAGDAEGAAQGARAIAAAAAAGDSPAYELAAPACEALQAFAAGDHADCAERLLPLLAATQALGGSHAQRDLLHLTAVGAAARAGHSALARALTDERAARKATATRATPTLECVPA